MMWARSPEHSYNRNGVYYCSRAVPADLRHRFPKREIKILLHAMSETNAAKSAAALSDRPERYWDGLRMEMATEQSGNGCRLSSFPTNCDAIILTFTRMRTLSREEERN